ncbi:MAG: HD domain-containing protein [Deltaproteobacteria bacterium]|nr:HD domain-containing protein [Deltaproteobacteria bacterium]MBN2670236.1 HD domain-containing protein [Deltaproteobacteria bacterium]
MSEAGILTAYNQILTSPRPDRGLDILSRTGVLAYTLPEVSALVGFGDEKQHKDVWVHTKKVIRQTPNRLVVRWAALLHDIGKVPTRKFNGNGQVSFIGHPEVGARMFEKIACRLPFPEDAQTEIRFLIAAHLRASAYQESWTDSAVRRFAVDTGPYLENLFDLCRADITSKYEEKVRRGLRQINLLAGRVLKILQEDAKPKALPKGLGQELISAFGIPPGKSLGDLMKRLTLAVERGTLPPEASFSVYVKYVLEHPEIR